VYSKEEDGVNQLTKSAEDDWLMNIKCATVRNKLKRIKKILPIGVAEYLVMHLSINSLV